MIESNQLKIKRVAIDKIIEATYNPRKQLKPGDPEYDAIKISIESYGLVEPLVLNEFNGVLVGGHQRLAVLKELGRTHVDVSLVNIDDEKKEKALNIALNKIQGEWDKQKLEDILLDLRSDGFKLEQTGFSLDELSDTFPKSFGAIEGKTDPDEIPSIPRKAITKPGDYWSLGKHLIFCGDAKNKKIEKEARLCFTSPPYNGNTHLDYNKKNNKKRKNKLYLNYDDNLPEKDYLSLIHSSIENCVDTVKDGFVFINLGYNKNSRGTYLKSIYPFVEKLWETIIWEKQAMPISIGLTRNCEFIFVLGIGNHGHINKLFENESNIWKISNANSQIPEHFACFPVALPERAIQLTTKKGDVVFDPFLGSGTTLIACERNERICYGIEIEPIYCDIIISRWEQFTGKKARKI